MASAAKQTYSATSRAQEQLVRCAARCCLLRDKEALASSTIRRPDICWCLAQDTTVRRKPDGEDAEAAEEDGESGSAAMAGRRTLDSLGAADSVIDAMDLAAAESDRLEAATKAEGGGSAAAAPNPLMLGLTPAAYVLRAVQVSVIKSAGTCSHTNAEGS